MTSLYKRETRWSIQQADELSIYSKIMVKWRVKIKCITMYKFENNSGNYSNTPFKGLAFVTFKMFIFEKKLLSNWSLTLQINIFTYFNYPYPLMSMNNLSSWVPYTPPPLIIKDSSNQWFRNSIFINSRILVSKHMDIGESK